MGLLLKRLIAASGEASTSSLLGRWRLAVSQKIDSVLILPWPGDLCCGPLIDGAVRDILPVAALFPLQTVWYLNAARLVTLLELTITRNGSQQATQMQWKVYNTSGALTLTVTDVITYSTLYETTRTRTVVP
jgi:hypothetical protein